MNIVRNMLKYTVGLPFLILFTTSVLAVGGLSEVCYWMVGIEFLRLPWDETIQVFRIWKPITEEK